MNNNNMRLLLMALLLCSFTQFLSAALPIYSSIKFILMQVGEGTISLDDALDKIVEPGLKKKIICDTYQKDFNDFLYHNKDHLDLYVKKSGFTEYKTDEACAHVTAYNLAQLHSIDRPLYAHLTEVFFTNPQAKATKSTPLFMYKNAPMQQYFFGYGNTNLFYYTHSDKLLYAKHLEQQGETGIQACASYSNSGLLVIGHKNIYALFDTKKDVVNITKPLPDNFPVISALCHTELPHLFVGVTNNGSALCFITVKEEPRARLKWKCIGTNPGITGIGSKGCVLYLHRSGNNDTVVVPYTLKDSEKIRNCDFSFAEASSLYNMILDHRLGGFSVTRKEHDTIKELIPDIFNKTLLIRLF